MPFCICYILPTSFLIKRLTSIPYFLQVIDNGNVTRSTITFTPKPSDNGKTITCRAENTKMVGAAIEDDWKITVHRE